MKGKSFAVLAAAAAIVVAGVVYIEGRQDAPGEVQGAGEAFLPAVQDRGNDIASVSVLRNGQTITVRKGGTGWEIAERGGYPAKTEQVRNLIVALAQLRASEPMTAKSENYAKLGVQDPSGEPGEPGAMGPALVTLKDSKDQTVASVIVGNPKWGSNPGVYVRRTGESQSWLAEGRVEIPSGLTSWTEPRILEIVRERTRSASVHHPDGEVVTVSRATPDAANFTVENIPPGKALKSASSGDALGAVLATVTFEDVAPLDTIDFTGEGGVPGPVCQFETFDGLSITVQTVDRDGKTWAQFAVAHDAAAALPTPPEGTSIKSAEDAAREAQELSARLAPWAFQLPSYKAVSMKTRMAELLSDTPPAQPASLEGAPMIDPGQLVQPPPLPQPAPEPPPAPAPGS